MIDFAQASSRIVIKASRDTIVLCAAAFTVTFALSHVVHFKPRPDTAPAAVTQEWTGHLADVAPAEGTEARTEKITSASLVLPKEKLALPKIDMRPLAKLRFCESGSCGSASVGVPLPPARRDVASKTSQRTANRDEPETRRILPPQPSLLSRLNPVAHVPSIIKKPFAFAGDTVASWIKRF